MRFQRHLMCVSLQSLLIAALASSGAAAADSRLAKAELFGITLKGANQTDLTKAVESKNAKLYKWGGNAAVYDASNLGLPCLKSLTAGFYEGVFAVIRYSNRNANEPSYRDGTCHPAEEEKLRKMIMQKYGPPQGAGQRDFNAEYISEGQYRWKFADGVEMVYRKEFMGSVELIYSDPGRVAALKAAAESADQNDTKRRGQQASDAF
ncbi:MAG TPA: hypothetical protein VJ654_20755 [Noviherbaspirillum sp.]|nr:hypothetical protein [Noviherbaspirillum sp.]